MIVVTRSKEKRSEMMTSETQLILEKLDNMDGKITALDTKITNVEVNLRKEIQEVRTELNDKIDNVNANLSGEIKEVRMTLEHEISKNIMLIAEGHQELNRKLDEALKVENEKEILLIRVNHLETELRKVKQHIPEIA